MKRLLIAAAAAVVMVGCSTNSNEGPEACGVVSVFSNPPETQDLYKVVVRRIDDSAVTEKSTYKLAPGTHVIKLNEVITDRRMGARVRNRSAQELEVEIEPDKKYHLASRFIPEKRHTTQGDYWVPEVWKVTDEVCSP